MVIMRHQPLSDDSWTDAEAIGLLQTLAGARRPRRVEAGDQTRRDVLTRTVEDEVIPRLVMARRPQKIVRAVQAIEQPSTEHVAHLTSLVLEQGQTEAIAFVEAMLNAGIGVESLLLELLAPTARKLGQMWEEDTCNFSDVTIGLMRLGNVLHLLSRSFVGEYEPQCAGPSALLVQMPGEQHGFGLAMVIQFFKRAGWNVRQDPAATRAELIGSVQNNWFALVGISVACSDRLEDLAADIRAIRRHSRNQSVGIMVGGPPFVAHPQLASLIGADATALDGRQAVQQAQSLISLLARDR